MESSFDSFSKGSQELRDVHLRQWISKARSKLDVKPGAPSSSEIEASDYTKLAVKVALKIAECLCEEERRSNGEGVASLPLIPLECIDARFVVVQVACYDPLMEGAFDSSGEFSKEWDFEKEWNEGEEAKLTAEVTIPTNETAPQEEDDCDYEAVEQVKIVHNIHGSTDVGSKYFRLFHLGKIFYELFSGKKPRHRLRRNSTPSPVDKFDSNISQNQHFPGQNFYPPFQEHQQLKRPSLPSKMDELNLGHDSLDANIPPFERRKSSSPLPKPFERRSSKSRRMAVTDEDENLTKFELSGLPQSICSLVANLMECQSGQSSLYNSFEDVCSDLRLMLVDPARFLDDIQVGGHMTLAMSDYLYGREQDISSIRLSYQRCRRGERCGGIVIIGSSGVGKSKLALQVQTLTSQDDGYLLSGKFDQFQDIVPFSVIGSAFNRCCELFLEDSNEAQRKNVSDALDSALGDQVHALREFVPSLEKLMNMPARATEDSIPCINSKKRLHHIFCVFVQMMSSFLFKPITLFLDDLQWADPGSLSLLQSLLLDAKGSRHLFFTGCARSEDIEDNDNFAKWLRIICDDIQIERIHIDPLDIFSVRKFVSDTLRLSPRVTEPLTDILYHKTRGNPLFLRRLMTSLKDEGLLFFSLSSRRWMWNEDKIRDQHIAGDVVELLMRNMRQLPSGIQTALKVTSCIGNKIDKNLLGVLSADVGMDLDAALQQAVKEGFMDDYGTNYRFVHDRVQYAAYNCIPPQQRNLDHLRFGLAICAYTLGNVSSDEIFFMAMNQINRGGAPAACVLDRSRKSMIAALNLKAGKRSLELADNVSALRYFDHGILFLEDDHWESQYEMSLELYDAAAETACAIHDDKAFKFYSDIVLQNAVTFDDKLNTMYAKVLCLKHMGLRRETRAEAFRLLEQLGEEHALSIGGTELSNSVQEVKVLLQGMTDESLLSMERTTDKRLVIMMKLYYDLYLILTLIEPSRVGAMGVRMIQLTLRNGICPLSPIAIASFGAFLTSSGDPKQGYRLGKLAFRLLEKLNAKEYLARVFLISYAFIAWTSEPLQSLAESHLNGYKVGALAGDLFYSHANYQNYNMLSFLSGQNLLILKGNTEKFAKRIMQKNRSRWIHHCYLLYLQAATLIEGLDPFVDHSIDGFPTEQQIMDQAVQENNWDLSLIGHIHELFRLFLFRDFNKIAEKASFYSLLTKERRYSRAIFIIGTFYEGLISFFLARQTKEEKWKINGEAALSSLKYWVGFSAWNFSNKVLLLEAEQNFLLGDHEKATMAYDAAIKEAHEHRFVHEEAIACELAGHYYCEMQDKSTAISLFTRARKCYASWGSTAKVHQMDKLIGDKSGSQSFASSIRRGKKPHPHVMNSRAA